MRDIPILFSAPMAIASLDGRKTKTRRVVMIPGVMPRTRYAITSPDEEFIQFDDGTFHYLSTAALSGPYPCPYGEPGDRLWGKETYWAFGFWETRFSSKKGRDEWHFVDMTIALGKPYRYAASMDDPGRRARYASATPEWWKRPAIFMPRAASRILLEVTDVRVERLQDMEGQAPYPGESDALAEGVHRIHHGDGDYYHSAFRDEPHPKNWSDPTDAFRELWESINGAGSWDANPWVWVISFKRISQVPT